MNMNQKRKIRVEIRNNNQEEKLTKVGINWEIPTYEKLYITARKERIWQKDLIIRSSAEEFITFKVQEKDKGIQVRYENETLWMTQKAMAELFNVEQPAIAKHLINIYNEKELDKDSTYSKMELVQKEGNRRVKRQVEFYNLDAIKNYILLDNCYYKDSKWLKDAEEADILNVALFNTTAKKWREFNPSLAKNSNVRDYASINELTVLSNLESHNAELIKEGKSKEERFEILNEIAKYQLDILNNAEKIKLLGNNKEGEKNE